MTAVDTMPNPPITDRGPLRKDSFPARGGDRVKLVYVDERDCTGRIEWLDDDCRIVHARDMALFSEAMPCFTSGVAIATKAGPRLAENLRPGDEVITRDHGHQVLLWVGESAYDWRALGANPLLRPVRLRAGALGQGVPERDMVLSPNHRILVSGQSQSTSGSEESLIALRELVGTPGIEYLALPSVCYYQFLFSGHQIILADGCWSESYHLNSAGMAGLKATDRDQLAQTVPEAFCEGAPEVPVARQIVGRSLVRSLIC